MASGAMVVLVGQLEFRTFASPLDSAMPVKTGIRFFSGWLDSGWRGNDRSEDPGIISIVIALSAEFLEMKVPSK